MSAEIEDIKRRLDKTEDYQEKMMITIQEVSITNTKLSIIVENMTDYQSRIRALEEANYNSNTILTIIKWLAISIVGACITISLTQIGQVIFEKLSK